MLLVLGLAIGTAPFSAQAGSGTVEKDKDTTKALFEDGIPDDIESWAEDNGATVNAQEERIDYVRFALDSDTEGDEFLDKLRNRSDVTWANYDAFARTTLVPNDPAWPVQYGPRIIDAPEAWNKTTGDDAVRLAVLDTGVDGTHPDLDAPCGLDRGSDSNGHGTHVSGIAAAEIDNGGHIAGMAQIDLESYPVCDNNGRCRISDIALNIVEASASGVDVISMSLGGDCETDDSAFCRGLQEAIDFAWQNNVVVVAASGNDGRERDVSEPGSMDHVVAVGSVDADKNRSSFSNGGFGLDLVAAGEDVRSTVPSTSGVCGPEADLMCNLTGTSMATPHVSGLASLLRSVCPSLANDRVVDVLTDNTEDLGDGGWDRLYGYGLPNADVALTDAESRCDGSL